MNTSRMISLVTSVAVNLLIVGFLTLWVVPVADIGELPAVAAVQHIARIFAWV